MKKPMQGIAPASVQTVEKAQHGLDFFDSLPASHTGGSFCLKNTLQI